MVFVIIRFWEKQARKSRRNTEAQVMAAFEPYKLKL
jgi:hypothetical protein